MYIHHNICIIIFAISTFDSLKKLASRNQSDMRVTMLWKYFPIKVGRVFQEFDIFLPYDITFVSFRRCFTINISDVSILENLTSAMESTSRTLKIVSYENISFPTNANLSFHSGWSLARMMRSKTFSSMITRPLFVQNVADLRPSSLESVGFPWLRWMWCTFLFRTQRKLLKSCNVFIRKTCGKFTFHMLVRLFVCFEWWCLS